MSKKQREVDYFPPQRPQPPVHPEPPEDPSEPELIVSLVNIDPNTIQAVEIGHTVTLQPNATPIPVSTVEGWRIGDVAQIDEDETRSGGYTVGTVVRVRRDQPHACRVRLA